MPDREWMERRRGRPQGRKVSSFGKLLLREMKHLGLTYERVVTESERLAELNSNPQMRIGKSTLGNIISGKIRQPGGTKLNSLKIILHLSRVEIDAALGLEPDRRFLQEMQSVIPRTHELSLDAVTRHRLVKMPILRSDVDLRETQFLQAVVHSWAKVEVEYLSRIYPPHLRYFVVGECDNYATPVAPPGSQLLVNTRLTKVRTSSNISYHERELFCVLTRRGFIVSYLEDGPGGGIILIPHPLSGHVREEIENGFRVIGRVAGIILPN